MPASSSDKKKKATSTPKTVLDKIVSAIRAHPATTPKGVSRVTLTKYLQSEWDVTNASAIKKALAKGVQSKVLIQTGQSFRVASDPVVEAPPQPQVEITELSPKSDTAETAARGDTVLVKYKGTLDDDSLFDEGSIDFVLGAGDVIKGWDQGILGMAVKGKRKLVVPSSLGYGKRGAPPEIPPNATLHFVVTLKQILQKAE